MRNNISYKTLLKEATKLKVFLAIFFMVSIVLLGYNIANSAFSAGDEAFAEFDSSTGVLRIFRDTAGAYTNGQTSGTKTYYAGLESITGTSTPKWNSKNRSIKTVTIEDTFSPLTAAQMFTSASNLTKINGIQNLDTSQVTNMTNMFAGCNSLKFLDLSHFNTSNVTTMYQMFYNCSSLTTLDLSSFNTSQVTSMHSMFSGCSSLTDVDISSFSTNYVSEIDFMFNGCSSLKKLNLSNLYGRASLMNGMFAGCTSLTSLDISGSFGLSSSSRVSNFFNETTSLRELKLGTNFKSSTYDTKLSGNWKRDGDTTTYAAADLISNYSGSTMAGTYRKIFDDEAFAEFDSSTGVLRIFRAATGTYTNGQTSGTKTYYAGIETITGSTNPLWYDNRTSITSVRIEDAFRPQTAYRLFYGCSNLTSINGISNLDTSQATTMYGMFRGCSSIASLDLSDFVTSQTTNMSYMFYGCSSLTKLDLSSFDTSSVTTVSYMFGSCTNLVSLNLSSFTTTSSTTVTNMLNITNLRTLTLGPNFTFKTGIGLSGNWRRDGTTTTYTASQLISSYTSSMAGTYRKMLDSEAFAEFDSSTGVLRIFRAAAGTYTNGQIDGTKTYYAGIETITGNTLPKWWSIKASVTSVVIEDIFRPLTAYCMFNTFSSATSITGLSKLDTSQVTTMYMMFSGCSALTSLDLSNFETSNVTNMYWMFRNCSSLTSLDLSSFDTSNVTNMEDMFYYTRNLNTLKLGRGFTATTNSLSSTRWKRKETGVIYFASDLLGNYSGSTMAGTYTTADIFAEFDSSTGVLRIFTDDAGLYTNEQVIGTKTYYAGIESVAGTNDPKWFSKRASITSVVIEDDFRPSTAYRMFYGCTNLTNITGITNFDTSKVINMYYMFYNCSSLTTLDITNFDTSRVTSFQGMFYGCSSLESLNFKSFNTSQVSHMGSMFRDCSSLTTLDISNFNTGQVVFMTDMFRNSGLTELNLSNFNTSNVGQIDGMFYGCSDLVTLDISSFNTSSASNKTNFFYGTTGLRVLKLGTNFVASDSSYLSGKWRRDGDTTVYTAANLIGNYSGSTMAGTYRWIPDGEAFAEFDSSTGVLRIFRDTAGTYTNGQTSGTKTYYAELESITGGTNPKWYSNRASITSVVVEDIFMPITAYSMFYGCTNLTSITNISNLDTAQVTNMYNMFRDCSSLTSLDLSSFNTSQVANMGSMFRDCSSLTTLDISNFNTSNVTVMLSTFDNADNLEILKLGKQFTSTPDNTGLAGNWRKDGTSTIYIGSVLMSSYNGSSMYGTYRRTPDGEAFAEFDSSTGVLRIFRDDAGAYTNGQTSGTKTYYAGIESTTYPKWSSIVDDIVSVVIEDEFMPSSATEMFSGCENLTTIMGISNLKTSQVRFMDYMFEDCSSLTSLDLSSFNTSNVTDMEGMFGGCSNLTSLNLSGFDTSQVTTMEGMFGGCSNLTSLNLSDFDTGHVVNMSSMFYNCTSLTNLNISSFNTSYVGNMSNMFNGCSSLTSLDLSGFDTSKPATRTAMFNNTSNLRILKLGNNFTSTANNTNLAGNWRRDGNSTIYAAANLISQYNGSTMAGTYRRIPDGEAYAEFDSSTGVLRIFRDDAGIYTNGQTSGTKTYYTGIETITGNTFPRWFSNRENITSVIIEDEFMPLTAFDMFYFDINMEEIEGIENLDVSQVTSMEYMFKDCPRLKKLDLSNFDTSNVNTMEYMFDGTYLLELKLGKHFSFVTSGGYPCLTSYWIRDGDNTVYQANDLMANYNGPTMAGTYRSQAKLSISEKVKGTFADTNRDFTFNMNLLDDEGEPVTGTYTYTGSKSGNLAFNNGIASFSLKHNETITAYFQAGYTFSIVQTNTDNYTLTTSYTSGEFIGGDAESSFTDTLNGTTPTGLFADIWPYLLLLLIALVSGTYLYKHSKI